MLCTKQRQPLFYESNNILASAVLLHLTAHDQIKRQYNLQVKLCSGNWLAIQLAGPRCDRADVCVHVAGAHEYRYVAITIIMPMLVNIGPLLRGTPARCGHRDTVSLAAVAQWHCIESMLPSGLCGLGAIQGCIVCRSKTKHGCQQR